jgi:hypothetical protein
VGNRNQEAIDRRNQIADQADEVRDDDLRETDGDQVFEREPQEASDEGIDVEPPEETGEDETPPEPPPAVKKHKIKVNGRDLELTEAELIERAQKVESADDYLRSSAEAFRRSLTAQPSAPAPATPDADPDAVSEDEIALARALQMGDEVEAAKAIRRIRAAPSLNQDELLRTIDARSRFQRAFDRFESEYSDVWDDPRLRTLATARDTELLEAGDSRPPYERLKAIGDELRAWKGTAPSVQTQRADKAARKASVANVPSAAARQTPSTETEREETVQDTIKAMAAARQGRQVQR